MTGRLSSIYNVGNLESLPQTAVLAVRHPTNGRTARHTERHINKLTRIAAQRSGEGPTEVRSARTLSTTFCLDARVHYIPLLSSSLFCLWRKFCNMWILLTYKGQGFGFFRGFFPFKISKGSPH